MEDKIKRKLRIYNPGAFVAGLFFMVVCIISVVSLWTEEIKQKSHGLEITQEFYIDSTLKNNTSPKYEAKIVGRIRNNSGEPIENIVLYFEVETLRDGKQATTEIAIDYLEVGEERYISVTKSAEQPYEIINKMKAQIGDGEKFAISKGDSFAFTLATSVTLLIIPGVMLVIAFKPKRGKELERELEIEEIKSEMERKIKKLKKAKGVRCEYCGLINQVDATRCEGCGATVEYKSEE